MISLLLLFSAPAWAQASSPEGTVTGFYKWYLHELNAERYPGRTSAKVAAVSSARLNRWFRTKTGREWDADYFIDAQDFDKDWETNIAVSNVAVHGSNADLHVTLGPKKPAANAIGQHVLKIKMVKEAGKWKIDHVDGY